MIGLRVVYAGDDKLFRAGRETSRSYRASARNRADVQSSTASAAVALASRARRASKKRHPREIAQETHQGSPPRRQLAPGRRALGLRPEGAFTKSFAARFPYAEDPRTSSAPSGKTLGRHGVGPSRWTRLDLRRLSGFGKTEVALPCRLRRRARRDPKVAVVVPTTLLCRQHFRNLHQRFAWVAGGGFRGSCPRLVTAKGRETTSGADLAEGRIDIIVGTHAILGKAGEVSTNLGLLIVTRSSISG